MTCSDLAETAAALIGRPVARVDMAGGGGNSRLYRVETADGAVYALKSYPPPERDPRDRLATEFGALSFLGRHGVTEVPAALALDRPRSLGLYQWIDGRPVSEPGLDEAEAAIAFLTRLHGLRRAAGAEALPLASEACLSAWDIVCQVRRRLARLDEVAPDEPALAAFLDESVRPLLAALTPPAADAPLAPSLRSLSPSDFGFHNALRQDGGRVVFIDFEYFGWDDPVKLISDTLWHPGMRLSPVVAERLRDGLLALYGAEDSGLAARFTAYHPLFGLRWCMILLNEFLPERWAVRAHAGATDHAQAKARQLAKAEVVVGRIGHRPVRSV